MSETVSSSRLSYLINSQKLPWSIIILGIAIRLIRYLHNLPLWFDESVIASDIIKRPLFDLVNPSNDYTQTGPVSFYILTKLSVLIFGNSEYALRLIPLCFSILSLFLFRKVANDILNRNSMLIALILFALLDPLIYYSTEVKPYSGDVFFTLLILLVVIRLLRSDYGIVLPVFTGIIAITSSNPSVFMLAGVGLALLFLSIRNTDMVRLKKALVICTMWSIAFLAVYFLYIDKITSGMAQNISVERALKMEKFNMPFPPSSLKDIQWYLDFFFDTFLFQDSIMYVKRITLPSLMAFSFLTGSILMFREKNQLFYLMFTPLILALFASALHIYPFKGRQILFLIPIFLILIAEGANYIAENVSIKTRFISIAFFTLLFIYPVAWASYNVKAPIVRSYIRPVLGKIAHNWNKGDILYVHFFSQYEFEYYTKYNPNKFSFDDNDVIIGVGPKGWYDIWRKNSIPTIYRSKINEKQDIQNLKETYRQDLSKLKGHKRAWILFTGDTTMEEYFLSVLDTIGKKISSYGESGRAIVYLYELG